MTDFSAEARNSCIWSTDAATALGLSAYKTPVQLWLEKRGEAEPEDISRIFAVRLGLAMQAPLAAMHHQDTGDELVPLATVEHRVVISDTPLGAHYDELNRTRRALHEIKCFGEMRRKDFGEPGTDEVPMDILAQVLHQQGVWMKNGSDEIVGTEINVSFGNRERLVFFVPVDVDALNSLVAELSKFWKMVKDGVAPPSRTAEDAARLFPKSKKGAQITASPSILRVVERLTSIVEAKKTVESEIDECQSQIKTFMGDNERLVSGDGKVIATWASSAPAVRIDTKRLRAEQPEIAEKYGVQSDPVRRFLLK